MNPPIDQRWALYRRDLGGYMHRWIFRHPRGTVRIHRILTSDEGRDWHDHPFDFTSVILRGGYIEHVPGCVCSTYDGRDPARYLGPTIRPKDGPCREYRAGSVVRRKAEDLHRLELLDGPALTLVFSGPYRRQWGFSTPEGWINYKEYQRSFYAP